MLPFGFIPNRKWAAVTSRASLNRMTGALFLTVVSFRFPLHRVGFPYCPSCPAWLRQGFGLGGFENSYKFPLCCAPSTHRQVPVTQLARFEHRKTATSATSSGVPMRPQGIVPKTLS